MERLNFESIQKLIDNKIKESLNLDYKKELDKYNDEIAKDISAFANANGGRIIYGIDEKDGLPDSINWISSKGIREKIESIILTKVQPEIKEYEIYSIDNPSNSSQVIFVVEIPESLDAPHMANNRYYIRRNFQSEPMEDSEVKNAVFRKGLRKALEFEVLQNVEMAKKHSETLSKYSEYQGKPATILLVPFSNEAWRAAVNSGVLFILKDRANDIVEAYSLIHEINYLFDSLRYEKYDINKDVFTQPDDARPEQGTWFSLNISKKIAKLRQILEKIKF